MVKKKTISKLNTLRNIIKVCMVFVINTKTITFSMGPDHLSYVLS